MTRAGPLREDPAARQRALLRHAHPDDRHARSPSASSPRKRRTCWSISSSNGASPTCAQYYVSVGGDEARARTRLLQTINDSLRAEFGNRTVHEVVSGERDKIMELMRAEGERGRVQDRRAGARRAHEARRPAAGSERVGLPPHGSRAQARGERAAVDGLRRVGEDPRRCRPPARGHPRAGLSRRAAHQGRGRRARRPAIHASAYEANPEFYAFYRSLEAYKQSFKSKSDVLVLEPNSEFFKYLRVRRQGRASSGGARAPIRVRTRERRP